ncbi:peptidase domain-containing ABC transporter [Gallaecimonas kandeliae]|uniref:peptidase domain-containing ABC transporter n=1 Tax=Gallaecimonas kandeliae TaxID=3029055 RepID=UPI002646FFFD|nr:peptidase domain-containing ABC transporter [Gallaecimonas kandeliae]WKE65631.1 peptidase domain-containing ABC transporter [Gallaecimonas kandeliae]
MKFFEKVLSWRRLPMIYQTEASTCGLACLAMVMQHHGKPVTITAIQESYPVSLKGITLKQVVSIANQYQLVSRPVKCDVEGLERIRLPAILHWDFNHFVVLKKIKNGRYYIHDPALGVRCLKQDEFARHFTGVVVEIQPGSDFSLRPQGGRLGLKWLFSNTKGTRKILVQTIWLTLLLELVSLASPLFVKYSVDYGIDLNDLSLVKWLALSFILVALVQSLLSLMRDYVGIYMGTQFNQFFVRSIFSHLLSLPLSYFEKRNTGDLIEKYHSTEQLRTLLTSNLVSVVLDGAIALGVGTAIFYISPVLGLITIGSFLFYLGFRWYCSNLTELKLRDKIKAKERETGIVIETLRSMSPIKIFAKEEDRLNVWQNKYSALMQSEVKLASFIQTQNSVRIVVLGIDTALCVYFGSELVLNGTMGIGTLFAFFMYKSQFSIKGNALITSLLDIKYVGVYLDRLADIVLANPEPEVSSGRLVSDGVEGRLTLSSVNFAYAVADLPILADVDLTIHPGEFVALIGPSGSGKTTLLKVMLGLYKPASGRIELDGVPIDELESGWYRRQFGVVMQDDRLLSASVVDNIAFEDPWADFEQVQQAAKQANIHEEIMRMPMKYNTPVGDLGSTLSGGQKQRILLARALYHNPRILLADEGTANLDSENEKTVLDELSRLPLTRLCIAHRPETLLRADRVLLLRDGRISEVSKMEALAMHDNSIGEPQLKLDVEAV